ncbi:hypothetical protein evm_013831, partial [Chilo suppressalis]
VSIGRGLNNSIVLPLLSISRNHCTIKKVNESWILLDNSAFGITVNGIPLGKGATKELRYEDVVVLEPTEEFVYKFTNPSEDFKIPSKRIKLEHVDDKNILHNVKLKFEESQSYEIKHIEEKIQNAKNMQESSKIMKDKLQSELNIKIELVENDFASQIENLRGEKNEIAEQKTILIAERDMQLASLKKEMEEKIADLMNQIQKHHETESELLKENSNLKEKLLKDRTEFLDELNKESSSKQDMLEKLEAKLREQKEACLKEKEEMEQKLKNETEQLRLAKEKELKQLEELKKQRETELQQELNDIRKDLEQQVQKAAQEKIQAEQILSEERKKLTDEEKAKIEQLLKEKNEIQRKLKDAQENSDKAMEQLKNHVATRETELAALAADRIQKQTEQSSHVIISLQEQLESVKNQLKSVETEKNALLENMVTVDIAKEGSSKETALAEVGELMENELQCSICAELFVGATTLNCSHTFCKYCITMWKKKKKDCPICRSVISSECKSLVLDSFIEKMVLNLTEDMKRKREELLKSREELETKLACQLSAGTSRRSHSYDESYSNSDSEFFEEGEEEELYEDYDDYDTYWPFRRRYYDDSSDSNSGSDEVADDSDELAGATAGDTAAVDNSAAATESPNATVSNSTDGRPNANGSSGRRGRVPGLPGAYYGGYGRCYSCGARGHWAPGCPNR